MNAIKLASMQAVKSKTALKQKYLGGDAGPARMQENRAVLNWIALRRRLGDYRRAKGLSVPQLAKALDVAETTVYRIENTDENPEHRPELQTITDWLETTDGPTLSVFFGEIEPPRAGDVRATLPTTSAVANGARAHDSGSLSSQDALTLDAFEHFVTELSVGIQAALGHALDHARPRKPPTGTDPD